ncbi:MAG: TolC family outer membrane protein [Steroidobacteraceae bacterium]
MAAAEDLWDVYRLALENEPQIQEAEATRRATRELLPEARGALLPQFTATASRAEDSEEGRRIGLTAGEIGLVDTDTETTSTNYGLEMRQPILRWDRWVRLAQARLEGDRADLDFRVRFDDLVLRAVDRYFAVLTAEDELAAAQANRRAIEEQLAQARDRFEVGLAAITDLHEARAAHDQSLAEEIEAEHGVRIARDALRTVTGTDIRGLARPPQHVELPGLPDGEPIWVERALESNAEISSARLSAEIADREVRRERAARFPAVDLVASRISVERDSDNLFNSLDVEGDSIRLELSVPVFAGGTISARTRQATFLRQAADRRFEGVQRDVEERARAAFLNVQASIARVAAFRQAVVSAEAALDATQAGYEAGTRTVSDVLQSQRNLLDAQTSLARATYDNMASRLRLAKVAGRLDEKLIRDVNALLTVR